MSEVIVIITEDDAKKALRLWLHEHKTQVTHWFSCQMWDYGEIPFWAFVVGLWSWESPFCGKYGFHVYQDGRVLLVGAMK